MNIRLELYQLLGKKNTQSMQFNHSLGQHILKNPLIVQALVDKVRMLVRKKKYIFATEFKIELSEIIKIGNWRS